MQKLKYVRLKRFDEIIVFPETISHDEFRYLNPISAGFCYIKTNEVYCFGESYSLSLESLPEDSEVATRQFFEDYMFKITNNNDITTD